MAPLHGQHGRQRLVGSFGGTSVSIKNFETLEDSKALSTPTALSMETKL
jgi:hypothetical protein